LYQRQIAERRNGKYAPIILGSAKVRMCTQSRQGGGRSHVPQGQRQVGIVADARCGAGHVGGRRTSLKNQQIVKYW